MREDIDLQYFRRCLDERYSNIMADKKSQKKDSAPVELDQARLGRLSRMDAMQQQAMSQATARLLEIEMQRIKTAQGRMESGEYGYCIMCEEEIAEKRLRFDPSLLTCISCAQEAEKK